jgi:uncharacterized protein YndB with AHSA1/START domain
MAVDTKVIERVISIDASPETVFRLITDPVEYVRWKGRLADLDPRPGGRFRVEFASGKDTAAGKFVEVIPNRRVVFTWGWEGNDHVPPGSSTVEIDLEREGTGTRLRLVHRGLPEGAIASHAEGWDYFLPRLEDVAEGRPAREAAHQTEAKQ